jgi:hypothetical protein
MESDDPAGAMTRIMEMQPAFITFTLRWVPGRPMLLYKLWARGSGLLEWRNPLAHPVIVDSGEITVNLGWFAPGPAQVHFGVFALEDVDRAATFVIHGGKVTPLLPAGDAAEKHVSIGRRETWEDESTYDVRRGA